MTRSKRSDEGAGGNTKLPAVVLNNRRAEPRPESRDRFGGDFPGKGDGFKKSGEKSRLLTEVLNITGPGNGP